MANFASYRDLLIKLLPRGRAWSIEADSAFSKLLEAFGVELARVDQRVQEVVREGDPLRTVEVLEEWEAEFGLPDECTVIDTTIYDRRHTLLQKIAATGGSSEQYFIDLLALRGVNIAISHKPASYVGAPVGAGLFGPSMLNTWFVNLPDLGADRFRAGQPAGRSLVVSVDPGSAVCTLEKYKPAHSYIVYTFNP